jgi:catechol 2,3-dioxygenase-like lactoylglutathione lyase family enzyme
MIDHIALQVSDVERSATFYTDVFGPLGIGTLKHGVEVLHAPRLWPEYHPTYYGVFLRDPDGHNVEAVCHAG